SARPEPAGRGGNFMALEDVRDSGHRVTIPLPTDAELSADAVAILAQNPPINVLRMFAGTQEMFPALIGMVRAVFYSDDIAPKLREVIVLRCAHLLDCPYEWQANVVMARNAGLPDAEIAELRTEQPLAQSAPAMRLISQATDELTRTG